MIWPTPAAPSALPLKGALPADRQSRLRGSRSMVDMVDTCTGLPTWIIERTAAMPVLAPNQPIEQREPVLVVQNRLAPGLHRFSLVVVNDRGVASEADVLTVSVRRGLVVDPVRPPVPPVVVQPVRPPAPGPVIDPSRPPVTGPVINPAVTPVVTPIVNPVVRPRGRAPRKGKQHGPE